MSTIAFLNIPMHGHINPTLPIVAELVRRGHRVTYHTWPAFRQEIEATGAVVRLHPGGDFPAPDPPMPVTLMEELARTTVRLLPAVLSDLRGTPPDLVVHDNACLWGAIAARELAVPAAASFTTFAYNRSVPSPTSASWALLASAAAHARHARGYLRARRELRRRYDTRGLPPLDLGNIRQPLNLVYTSRTFQPGAEDLAPSYRFVGPSIGARPVDPSLPVEPLRDPVMYASLGTLFSADPRMLRTFATALAPLGGTVIISTGHTDPAALGPLPAQVIARHSVPQLQVLGRAALFITHGGMNSVNEALYAGVPMLVVPQGADQPLVARRVTELGAGLSLRNRDVTEDAVRALARSLLEVPRFRSAANTLAAAQRGAGGFRRAADELERYLRDSVPTDRPAPAPARGAAPGPGAGPGTGAGASPGPALGPGPGAGPAPPFHDPSPRG
ncbi:macrolide family glycosyltransferase [Streptomyces chromofuscus]|uniref:Oleandomycin glycosyltransferase n=1 Tax=Streptomyces chromofuscus TaxID=42881 RepID=A0A7M2TBQ2_STRCW|nr:macrolide family glycosyltransferase [Streptomyces chromofuscus]QOV44771.1 oleandomycin glycosyltransferase [Streptomyces chromofuscus]GGT00357.1 oleandomycin glycosyltransferase [Streptomyces chromofuscus]